jgi:hypothetical protein
VVANTFKSGIQFSMLKSHMAYVKRICREAARVKAKANSKGPKHLLKTKMTN